MTIELDNNSYIVGFWFCSDPKTGNDWMCCVKRDPKDNGWFGQYRFRYCKDEKIWDSDDEKSWYNFKVPVSESEEDIIKSIDKLAMIIQLNFPNADKIIVRGDIKKLLKLAKGHPWMNLKTETIPKEKH